MKIFILSIICLSFTALASAQALSYNTFAANADQSGLYRQPGSEQSLEQQSAASASAQQSTGGFRMENLEFGGSFGLQFRNSSTFLNISPQVGYRFNNYFSSGVGFSYSYFRQNNGAGVQDYSDNYLGANVYARFMPTYYLRIQLQPEVHRFWGTQFPDTKIVTALLVGAGGFVPINERSGFSVMLFYDILQHNYSPYGNEVFYSVGYTYEF